MPEQTTVPPESAPAPQIVEKPEPAPVAGLRPSRALLTEAWGIYTKKVGTIVGIVLVLAVAAVASILLGMLALMGLGVIDLAMLANGKVPAALTGTALASMLGVGLVVLLAVVFAAVWSNLASLTVIVHHEERITIRDAYRRARPLVAAYAWVGVLSGFLLTLGFILLIVPGVIAWVWFGSVGYVFVAENVRGAAALRRSREYVRGIWSAAFSRYAYMAGIALLANILLNMVAEGLSGIVMALVLTPLSTAYGFVLYQDLKRLRPEI